MGNDCIAQGCRLKATKLSRGGLTVLLILVETRTTTTTTTATTPIKLTGPKKSKDLKKHKGVTANHAMTFFIESNVQNK